MDSKTILNKVKAILVADTTLSGYVQKFLIGPRPIVYDTIYPCIVLDVPSDRLAASARNNLQENNLVINITPAISVSDREKAIIGDATHKGILDMIADIKAALKAKYPSLDKTCLYFTLSAETIEDFSDMQGKLADIAMTVIYRESV